MTGVLLALLSALSYGASDFTAGVLSRREHFVLVGWVAGLTSTVAAGLVVVVLGTHLPDQSTLAWSAFAGVGGGAGTLALYHGLAVGHMSVAGPLSAVGAAGLPVALDLVTGGPLSTAALVGIAAALPGIWLVSTTRGRIGYRGGVREGLLAGVGFAILFIGLDRAGSGAGLWPVAISQVASLLLLTVMVVIGRRKDVEQAGRPGRAAGEDGRGSVRPPWRATVPGLLGAAATVFYFLSTHHAPLGVVAVITSLYPAVTVGLAAALLHERTTTVQNVGLVLCAAAICAFVAS